MFFFNLRVALKSIRNTPLISLVTVLGIGLGIAVSTTVIALYTNSANDPIPEKSDRLFNIRLDSWEPGHQFFGVRPGDPPKTMTYQDMHAIKDNGIPRARTAVATATGFVFPDNRDLKPFRAGIQLVHADFFAMMQAPFAYGSGWDRQADVERQPLVVLSADANEELFGGGDNVGRHVKIGPIQYRVKGILKPWQPFPVYWDIINNPMGTPMDYYIPFDMMRVPDSELQRSGNTDNWGNIRIPPDDPDAFYRISEMCWVQYWVEMSPRDVDAYHAYLADFVNKQKAVGRFPKPINNRVTPLLAWMEIREITPPVMRLMVVVSLLFLGVCALNLTGLLLGKFLARSNLVGVHRALGARKAHIFWQHLLECNLVGILGGLIGVGLSVAFLRLVNVLLSSGYISDRMYELNPSALGLALVLSLGAGMIAGLYPAWRACNIVPAVQLKIQ